LHPDSQKRAHGRFAHHLSTPPPRSRSNGDEVPAFEIDTDPFVYALGAQLRSDVVGTVVIAREHLPYVRPALHTRTPETD